MSLIDNIQFISVESRKGGVGKTTVSFALAQALLSKGYQVLLLDLDLTGTRIGDSFISQHPFINSIQFKGNQLNLVDLYQRFYLKGIKIPEYGDLSPDKTKCNYISSDIYCGKGNQPIQDPRVLMDTLHAFWMRKLILQLAGSFAEFVSKDAGKGILIIDNAPGFSSLETMVHEMLTGIGPDNGKFLLVSSADDQDWNAICQSSGLIHTMLKHKVLGAFYYNSLCGKGHQKKIDSPYFDEIWKELCMTNGQEPEFFSKVKEEPQPEQYIQIVVNKIPKGSQFKETSELGIRVVTLPFSTSLRTYFSTLLSKDDSMSINDDLDLSGDVLKLLEDNSIFEKRLEVKHIISSRIKLWRPLESFVSISQYYSGQEYEVKSVASALKAALESPIVKKASADTKEERIVRQFIEELCGDKNAGIITEEAAYLLEQAGSNYPLVLQTEKRHLQHLSEPIMLVGKTIYYLKVYPQICTLLNGLLKSASLDLDYSIIIDRGESIMDGQVGFSPEFWDTWNELLVREMNLDSLKGKIAVVLNNWGI